MRRQPPAQLFPLYGYWYGYETEMDDEMALKMLIDAAERGYLVSHVNIVKIYSEGKYVHKNFRLAQTWQEKLIERYRLLYEKDDSASARREYETALRHLGDLLMKEGYARRAKQYYRKADQLTDQGN